MNINIKNKINMKWTSSGTLRRAPQTTFSTTTTTTTTDFFLLFSSQLKIRHPVCDQRVLHQKSPRQGRKGNSSTKRMSTATQTQCKFRK